MSNPIDAAGTEEAPPERCGEKRPKDAGSWWLNEEQYDSVAPCCDKPAGHDGPHWCDEWRPKHAPDTW
jgi:hypothetical protein